MKADRRSWEPAGGAPSWLPARSACLPAVRRTAAAKRGKTRKTNSLLTLFASSSSVAFLFHPFFYFHIHTHTPTRTLGPIFCSISLVLSGGFLFCSTVHAYACLCMLTATMPCKSIYALQTFSFLLTTSFFLPYWGFYVIYATQSCVYL